MKKQSNEAAPRFHSHREGLYRSLLPLAAFILILIINTIFTKNFWHVDIRNHQFFGTIFDIGRQASPEILMALAMTLVIAGTKGIDLSVGAVAAMAAGIAALYLIAPHPMSLAVIIAISLGAGAVAGLWNGFLVSYLGIQPFIATLILMVAGRGIAQLIVQGQIITLPVTSPICNTFCAMSNGAWFFIPIRFYIVAIVASITWFLARKTVIGVYIEAVGGNETAAKYCGINAAAVKLFVFAFSGVCAALAGLILTGDVRSADPNTLALNDHNELDAILAVIIGGTAFTGGRFNLFGSVVGALIMRTLMIQIFSSDMTWGYALVLKAVTVIIVCLIQSPQFRALFGRGISRRSK